MDADYINWLYLKTVFKNCGVEKKEITGLKNYRV